MLAVKARTLFASKSTYDHRMFLSLFRFKILKHGLNLLLSTNALVVNSLFSFPPSIRYRSIPIDILAVGLCVSALFAQKAPYIPKNVRYLCTCFSTLDKRVTLSTFEIQPRSGHVSASPSIRYSILDYSAHIQYISALPICFSIMPSQSTLSS